jgi:hypothetical protein
VPEGLIEFVIFNLHDIMSLADHQCHPDYFLWNMARMDTVFGIDAEEKRLKV